MNYIIVIQIEEFCYIYTSELDSDTIFKQLDDIFFNYHTYDVLKMDQVKNVKLVAQYTIKGNMIYFGKNIRGVTNGIVSMSIVLKYENFSLKSYIRERENFSILLLDELMSDEYSHVNALFPDMLICAN